jgi:hypothetical protein
LSPSEGAPNVLIAWTIRKRLLKSGFHRCEIPISLGLLCRFKILPEECRIGLANGIPHEKWTGG